MWIGPRILIMNGSYSVFNWLRNSLQWISLSQCFWHLEKCHDFIFKLLENLFQTCRMNFPYFPVLLFRQYYVDGWTSLELIRIHSTSTKFIIHISDSFASTYQIMCNSSNIPSCPKFLPLNTWHYSDRNNSSVSVSLIYRSWLFVSVGNLSTSTRPSMIHLSHFATAPCMVLPWPVSSPRIAFNTGFCTCWLACLPLSPNSHGLWGQKG